MVKLKVDYIHFLYLWNGTMEGFIDRYGMPCLKPEKQ